MFVLTVLCVTCSSLNAAKPQTLCYIDQNLFSFLTKYPFKMFKSCKWHLKCSDVTLVAVCLRVVHYLSFITACFFVLKMLNYEVQETTWMWQNKNANSVVWNCQFYDSSGDTALPAITIWSLFTFWWQSSVPCLYLHLCHRLWPTCHVESEGLVKMIAWGCFYLIPAWPLSLVMVTKFSLIAQDFTAHLSLWTPITCRACIKKEYMATHCFVSGCHHFIWDVNCFRAGIRSQPSVLKGGLAPGPPDQNYLDVM